jgi:hypothetical protein
VGQLGNKILGACIGATVELSQLESHNILATAYQKGIARFQFWISRFSLVLCQVYNACCLNLVAEARIDG